MGRVGAVLTDIDGVLTVAWKPLPGTVAAMRRLREAGIPLVLVTNTTSRTRASIATKLAGQGFPVTAEDILTAPAATAAHLREHHPGARCLLINSGDVRDDLTGVTLVDEEGEGEGGSEGGSEGETSGHGAAPDVVVIGGAGDAFGYAELNRAFRHLQRGARLVAMHRNLYWRTATGLDLDTGAFLLGLERAARVEAEITGKPAGSFFAAALAHLGVTASEALMVGDDIESDVLAAQAAGVTGVLVRTGKYLPETHRAAEGTPDHVIDSFADLPGLLERLRA
ncbi:HAD-IIA family hydrolase [Streptomyces sp. NBC_00893]|uniref:HAD-IIA family hydrolase n=1 Tax=Streptomyces sp. NBC_00893 TaxID=2975862 RepID=UPI002257E5E6|nr:HAD-IIA family hydrolase [Streptomyces sp. NBC_00893]MCX4846914.1 HAD-IIA family hydrolase [Streptomyces sp. NBC_00893]